MNTRQAHLTLDQVTALIGIGDKVNGLVGELETDSVAIEAVGHYAHACHHISEAANALLEAMRLSSHPLNQASKRVELSLCADDAHDLAHLLKETARKLEQGPRDLQVTTADDALRMGRDGLMVGTFKVADRVGGQN